MISRLTLAVAALAFAGAAQAQAPSKVADACTGDYQKLCSTTIPGGGRVLKCLVAHKDEVSDACKTALREEADKRKAAAAK